jgi:hypothetical protein
VDGADQAIEVLGQLVDRLENPSEGLLPAVEEAVLPDLEAQGVWQNRTGRYAGSWEADVTGPYTVTVSNPVEYAAPLEYGWATRAGNFVESPGVLLPTVIARLEDIKAGLAQWLTSLL